MSAEDICILLCAGAVDGIGAEVAAVVVSTGFVSVR